MRILQGTVQLQFWYIPFITIVFFFAPLLFMLPHKVFFALMIPSIACLIAVDRPHDILTIQGFLCFVPGFLLGICYAMDKERLFRIFKSCFWYFLAASLICSLCIFDLGRQKSLTSLHKLFTIPVVIVLLSFLENKKSDILILIANLSFTLYFLHFLIVQPLDIPITMDMQLFGVTSFAVICFMRTFLTFAFLLVFCWSIKILTGKYSRMLAGS